VQEIVNEMKRLFYLFVAAVACLVSCNKDSEVKDLELNSDLIVGSWYIDAYTTNVYQNGELVNSKTDTVSSRPIGRQHYSLLVLEKDGKGFSQNLDIVKDGFLYKTEKSAEHPLTWSLSVQEKALHLTQDGRDRVITIVEWASDCIKAILTDEETETAKYELVISLVKGTPDPIVKYKEFCSAIIKKWQDGEDRTSTSYSYSDGQREGGHTSIVKDGHLVENFSFDSQGTITSKSTYSYSGNTITEMSYVNYDGDSILTVESKSVTEYVDATYENTLKETVEFYGEDGSLTFKSLTDYTYKDKRLMLVEIFSSESEADAYQLTSKEVYSYTDDNNYEMISYYADTIPEHRTVFSGNDTESTISYYSYNYYNSVTNQVVPGWTKVSSYYNRYNNKDKIDPIEHINSSLNDNFEFVETSHSYYTYDENELPISVKVIDSDGTFIYTTSYELFEGFIVSEKSYLDGEILYERVVSIRDGNLVFSEYEFGDGKMELVYETTYFM